MRRNVDHPTAPTRVAEFFEMRESLRQLLRPGLIGFYDHIELVEIIATPRGQQTMNVLSIVVLGEGKLNAESAGAPVALTTERIRVNAFKDWSFGVARTFRSVSALEQALVSFSETGVWGLSGMPLTVGTLQPQPPVFAPPDGTVQVPMNRLLKNNFWAGSHVFRLADLEKAPFEPFFADRRRLQSLSDAISPLVPLALSANAAKNIAAFPWTPSIERP